MKVVKAAVSAILEQVYCQTYLPACVSLLSLQCFRGREEERIYSQEPGYEPREDYSFMNLAGNQRSSEVEDLNNKG